MDQSLVSLICIKREMVIKSRPLKAGIAQLVERNLAKVEVASSSLVSSSKIQLGKWVCMVALVPQTPFSLFGFNVSQ